eukprot:3296042-Pleurochrysis_carterae.AAC.1
MSRTLHSARALLASSRDSSISRVRCCAMSDVCSGEKEGKPTLSAAASAPSALGERRRAAPSPSLSALTLAPAESSVVLALAPPSALRTSCCARRCPRSEFSTFASNASVLPTASRPAVPPPPYCRDAAKRSSCTALCASSWRRACVPSSVGGGAVVLRAFCHSSLSSRLSIRATASAAGGG